MSLNPTLIAEQFQTEANIVSVLPYGSGLINDTFLVKTDNSELTYVLQRKNKSVFHDVPALVRNMDKVLSHIEKKVKEAGGDVCREMLSIIPTKQLDRFYKDENDEYWLMTRFIPDTISYDCADTVDLAFRGGLGLGLFHSQISDFNEVLEETIKGFHKIDWRFKQWDSVLEADCVKRKAELSDEISFMEARRSEMLEFYALIESGIIPRRVTHNDTKISNFLFDKKSGDVLCAIDLDTLMSGSFLNDYGDAIRSFANSGDEDEPDFDKVSLDFRKFSAYSKAYLLKMKGLLAQSEVANLVFSVRYIVFEQALRFLTDYLDGDKYYKINYEQHNLIRARSQMKLLQSVEVQVNDMENEILKILNY